MNSNGDKMTSWGKFYHPVHQKDDKEKVWGDLWVEVSAAVKRWIKRWSESSSNITDCFHHLHMENHTEMIICDTKFRKEELWEVRKHEKGIGCSTWTFPHCVKRTCLWMVLWSRLQTSLDRWLLGRGGAGSSYLLTIVIWAGPLNDWINVFDASASIYFKQMYNV